MTKMTVSNLFGAFTYTGWYKMTKADVDKIEDLSQKLVDVLKDSGMRRDAETLENVLYDILEEAKLRISED